MMIRENTRDDVQPVRFEACRRHYLALYLISMSVGLGISYYFVIREFEATERIWPFVVVLGAWAVAILCSDFSHLTIVITDAAVVGPASDTTPHSWGRRKKPPQEILLSEIDLERSGPPSKLLSMCTGYIIVASSGKRVILHSIFLGPRQARNAYRTIRERVRQIQGVSGLAVEAQ